MQAGEQGQIRQLGDTAALPSNDNPFFLTRSLCDRLGGSGHVHSRPRPGTHRRSYVFLVPLQSGETAGDLQQSGRSKLGATGDETPGVLNPEAEERVITHLLKEPTEPGRVWEENQSHTYPII